jgi:hypothetical protein
MTLPSASATFGALALYRVWSQARRRMANRAAAMTTSGSRRASAGVDQQMDVPQFAD